MTDTSPPKFDWFSRLLAAALAGPIPVLILVVAFVGGIVALAITPREEEPQIVVPLG